MKKYCIFLAALLLASCSHTNEELQKMAEKSVSQHNYKRAENYYLKLNDDENVKKMRILQAKTLVNDNRFVQAVKYAKKNELDTKIVLDEILQYSMKKKNIQSAEKIFAQETSGDDLKQFYVKAIKYCEESENSKDRACDEWGLRKYYEKTGDNKLMQKFLLKQAQDCEKQWDVKSSAAYCVKEYQKLDDKNELINYYKRTAVRFEKSGETYDLERATEYYKLADDNKSAQRIILDLARTYESKNWIKEAYKQYKMLDDKSYLDKFIDDLSYDCEKRQRIYIKTIDFDNCKYVAEYYQENNLLQKMSKFSKRILKEVRQDFYNKNSTDLYPFFSTIFNSNCQQGDEQACEDYAKTLVQLKNYTKARTIFANLCNKNYQHSCYSLALMNFKGQGANFNDYDEALELFKKACVNAHNDACVYAGKMYISGVGVDVSKMQALKYYKIACKRNYKYACKLYNGLANGTYIETFSGTREVYYYNR